MQRLTAEELKRLASHQAPCTLSIYMPTHKGGNQTRQDPIRLKNLIRQAADQMLAMGLRDPEARQRLAPLSALLEDSEFWRNQDEGLGLLAWGPDMHVYRLSQPVPEIVTVQDRFYLKPLLWLMDGDGEFYILALSQNSVRLMRARRERIEEVRLENAPRGLVDVLRYVDAEGQLQYHTQISGQVHGRRTPMFHGRGVGAADHAYDKRRLLEYCQMIDHAVSRAIADKRAPLVLAGAEPLVGLYRETSSYGNIWPEVLRGNPDRQEPAQLHAQAVPLARPIFDACRKRAITLYHQAAGGGLASSNLREVLAAADDQKVGALFVSLDDQRWGRYDPASKRAEMHSTRQAGDQDLLDLAAVMTYRGGGGVYVMARDQMPDRSPVAAAFRFPT